MVLVLRTDAAWQQGQFLIQGKKSRATGGSGVIASLQFDVVSTRALQVTSTVPARLQGRPALGTAQVFGQGLAAPLTR